MDLLEHHCSQQQQAGPVEDVWPLLLHTTGNTTDTLQPEQVRPAGWMAWHRFESHSKASQSGQCYSTG